MVTLKSWRVAGLMAVGIAAAGLGGPVTAPAHAVPSAPCYNGIAPMDPYVDNCAIPSRPPRVLGSAPDQTALLNCSVGGSVWRAICISQFVNGGPYPGVAIGIG